MRGRGRAGFRNGAFFLLSLNKIGEDRASFINLPFAGLIVKFKFLIPCLLLTGCSTTVTIITSPTGGYVTEKGTGTAFGVAPVTVSYDSASLNSNRDSQGCRVGKGVTVNWVSGASVEVPYIQMCGNKSNYNLSIERPEYPRIKEDLEFALKVESLNTQKSALQQEKDAAALDLYLRLQEKKGVHKTCKNVVSSAQQSRTYCYEQD